MDVGPLMFVAQAIYGSTDTSVLNKVVVWFTLLIIFVFDPMAIALLLASQSVGTPRVFVPFVQRVDVDEQPEVTITTTDGSGYIDENGDYHNGDFHMSRMPGSGVAPLTVGEGVAPLTIGRNSELRWPENSTDRTIVTTTDGRQYANWHTDIPAPTAYDLHTDAHADMGGGPGTIETPLEEALNDAHADCGTIELKPIIPQRPKERSRAAEAHRLK